MSDIKQNDILTAFQDSSFYSGWRYVTDGADEMLACMQDGSLKSGIIYRGCSTPDIEKEKYVSNKDFLKLLVQLRKIVK